MCRISTGSAMMAIMVVGADHLEPTFGMKDDSATTTASTKIRLYGNLLLGYEPSAGTTVTARR
jgi:hypothetical protein